MRLKTKLMLAAVPVTAVVVAGGIIAISIKVYKRRRKEAKRILSNEVRGSLQDLCSLKGEDFIPDGMGSSRFQRKLDTLTDRQLIGVYIIIKMVEVLRTRGVDIHDMSKDDVVSELASLRAATHDRQDRKELLKQIGSFGAETIQSMLADGIQLSKLAIQGA